MIVKPLGIRESDTREDADNKEPELLDSFERADEPRES